MNCPKCNQENVNDAKYCTECGTSLFKVCENCGKPSQWTTKFCSECGNKFPPFDLIVEFYKRKMLFYDDIIICVSKNGKYIIARNKDKYKLLNICTLAPVLDFELDDINLVYINNGLEEYNFIAAKKDGLWGILNPITGDVICNFNYEDCILVNYEGDYRLNGTVILKVNGKWGKIDGNTGQVILPFIYDEIYDSALDDYHNDFDLVKHDGYWGVIADGKQLIPFEYIEIGYRVNDRWGYLNDWATNDSCIPPSLYKSGKWGIVNIYNGETILRPEYDEIILFEDDKYKVRKGERWGVVNNHDGKTVLTCEFEQIEIIRRSGDYKVKKDEKCGIVSSNGKIVIECKYDDIVEWGDYDDILYGQYVKKHVYKLQYENKWGISSDGVLILKCEYDEINQRFYQEVEYGLYDEKRIVSKYYYIMRIEDKWGLCTNCRIELPCVYDEIEECGRYFKLRKGNKLGVGSKNGEVLPCEYDEIFFNEYSSDITMRIGGKWGKVVYRYHKFLPPERFDYACIYSEDEIKKLR